MTHAHRSAAWITAVQALVSLGAIVALAFAPPAQGPRLILPLLPGARPALLASRNHWPIVARAPLGAVIARGSGGGWAGLRAGVLMLAAPPSACGGEVAA